jgi:hypothetical protein
MSVHAGTILTVGGANVLDRLQSAGLGDVRLPIETIREVGNELVVDKIPGEADFTFTMECYTSTSEMLAFLTGKVGAAASGSPPGGSDPDGTKYRWEDTQTVNIVSPWKDPTTGSAGTVEAGHIVPGYFPTRVRYRFGVTDNATQESELSGGSFYYASHAPVENYANGTGAVLAFTTADPVVGHRKGGGTGTEIRYVFGVIVGQKLMIEGVDYTVSGGSIAAPAAVTITFVTPPPTGVGNVRFAYFTNAAKAYPQSSHAAAAVVPGAVRGRNIRVFLGSGGARQRIASVQSIELEATTESEVEREMGSDEIVGRTINGRDANGTLTVRSRDADSFLALLSKVTGYSTTEVFGYFNQGYTVPVEIQIVNPKDNAQVMKTLVVVDGVFQPPGTPARVNTPTDFGLQFSSQNGTFFEVKGAWDGSV